MIEEEGGAIDESPGEILRAREAFVENLGLALLGVLLAAAPAEAQQVVSI